MKKVWILLVMALVTAGAVFAQTKITVQVVNPEAVNLSTAEAAWLPGQIQDSLKSNLQEYLGMKTVVDSSAEAKVKKLQADSESEARNENTAIELGKLTTAKYAVFTKIRKTGKGYTISIDYTDLTTGEVTASVTGSEYTAVEELYSSKGAVDEITVGLAKKLGIRLSELTEAALTRGTADFTWDQQVEVARQNEKQYKDLIAQYDKEIASLKTSNDIAAVENKNKLEAEKALLEEKQKAEQKRLEELKEQQERAAADEKLEAERSIALKTQRDQMAKDAAAKAAEVRKLKMEKQGVLGQINVIESKKKALVEIRQSVESRCQELYDHMKKDQVSEEKKIRNKSYSTVELDDNGKPTEAAKIRREKQIKQSYENLEVKFFADCEEVKNSTMEQQTALLTEIRADQKALSVTRTVSSMGDELKVSFGKYSGSKNGWNAYLSLYSDGVLLYTDSFIVNYDALSGKKAPDMATELEDNVIEEYTNNVDMYSSLLTRGDPILYFELDYNVAAEGDDKPSEYTFNFSKIRVINTISGKTVQTAVLDKKQPRTMKPAWDVREISGIEEKEFNILDAEKKETVEKIKREALDKARREAIYANFVTEYVNLFTEVPGKNLSIMKTEVTQRLYAYIMGENPSYKKRDNNPVECVSWYDAVYFCNKLSEKLGLTPVYSVDGKTDVTEWGYTPHKDNLIRGDIKQNTSADGFRLPTLEEWQYAARGGKNYTYAGSNNLDEVGWYVTNSGDKTHPVAQKKANGYGLFDMSGNVWEWVWGSYDDYGRDYSYRDFRRYSCGGGYCYYGSDDYCEVDGRCSYLAGGRYDYIGFRVVCSPSSK